MFSIETDIFVYLIDIKINGHIVERWKKKKKVIYFKNRHLLQILLFQKTIQIKGKGPH